MLSLLLLDEIAQMLLIMLMGWGIVKAGILKSEDSRGLSMILLYVITPCVIIDAFQLQRTPETLSMLCFSAVAAVALNLISLLGGTLFSRLLHLDAVETGSAIYANSGNLAIPLVSSIFGAEWLMYATTYNMVQNVMVWTHGRILISGSRKVSLRQALCNVNIIAIAVGAVLFLFQIPLPALLVGALDKVGSTVGVVAMLIIGMLMADVDWKRLGEYRSIWKPLALRLLVLPLLMAVIIRYPGFSTLAPHAETLLIITLIPASSPTANCVTQFCQMYHQDARYAGLISTVSMILCVVTIPLVVAFAQM